MPKLKSKRSASRRRTSNSGILFVVSAPSGAGKTTVVAELLKRDRSLARTVSHTTRVRRAGEKEGRAYHFVSRAGFRQMVRRQAFVEWVSYCGHLYGTSRGTVREILGSGRDAVLVIESHGGRAIARLYPGAVRILILPPDRATLRKRLKGRGEKNEARLASATREVRSMRHYDYLVVNDRLDSAVEGLVSIVRAERQRMKRGEGMLRKFFR